MQNVTVRPMRGDEFEQWLDELAHLFAEEKVAAGDWPAEGSVSRARQLIVAQLPRGLETPRMLLLRGLDANGEAIGRAWVNLDHPRGIADVAFLSDIAVVPSRRGAGLGRALLAAVEQAAREAGARALELNVFGHNVIARDLYASSGYGVVAQQMRKPL